MQQLCVFTTLGWHGWQHLTRPWPLSCACLPLFWRLLFFGHCLWPLFVATVWTTVCGLSVVLFVGAVCGHCLWPLFVATVYGCSVCGCSVCGYCLATCLWLLFVATVYSYCLWRRRRSSASNASSPVFSPVSHPRRSSAGRRRAPAYPHHCSHPSHTTSAGRGLVVTRRGSSSSRPRLNPLLTPISSSLVVARRRRPPRFYSHPYPHPYPHPRSSPAVRTPAPVVGWSSSRPRLHPHHYPHPYPHPRFAPPASVVGWSSWRPRLYPHHYPHPRSSPPPVLTTRGSHHPRRSSPRRHRPRASILTPGPHHPRSSPILSGQD